MNILQAIQQQSSPMYNYQSMLQNNPNYKQAMHIIQQNGGDPQKAFYSQASLMGINPNQVLNMLRMQ